MMPADGYYFYYWPWTRLVWKDVRWSRLARTYYLLKSNFFHGIIEPHSIQSRERNSSQLWLIFCCAQICIYMPLDIFLCCNWPISLGFLGITTYYCRSIVETTQQRGQIYHENTQLALHDSAMISGLTLLTIIARESGEFPTDPPCGHNPAKGVFYDSGTT